MGAGRCGTLDNLLNNNKQEVMPYSQTVDIFPVLAPEAAFGVASGATAPGPVLGPAPSQQLFIACLISTYCYLFLANVTSYDQDVDI